MKEILQIVKSLSASELEKVINKLTSVHEKKLASEAEKSRLESEAAKAVTEARQKIQEIAKASGVTLEQLGFIQTAQPETPVANKPKRRNKRNLDNQVFEINGSKLNLVFTRKAKQLLESGKAKRYADLTEQQKLVASTVMEEYLANRANPISAD